MDVLHSKRLAVAHYCAGILCVEHIFGHHRNILGAHIEGAVECVGAALQQKAGEVVDTLAQLFE